MKAMIRWTHRIEDAVLVSVLLAMILIAGLDILARLLFGGGFSWAPPLLRIMVLWLGLLGALFATRSREHIAIDLINRLGGPTLKRWLLVVTSLFSATICLIIAYHSKVFVESAYEWGDVAFEGLPAWPFQLIIPVTFGFMAIRFLLHTGLALFNQHDTSTEGTEI